MKMRGTDGTGSVRCWPLNFRKSGGLELTGARNGAGSSKKCLQKSAGSPTGFGVPAITSVRFWKALTPRFAIVTLSRHGLKKTHEAIRTPDDQRQNKLHGPRHCDRAWLRRSHDRFEPEALGHLLSGQGEVLQKPLGDGAGDAPQPPVKTYGAHAGRIPQRSDGEIWGQVHG